MTDITKIDHDGPVTTCDANDLHAMTSIGWRVLAVTKVTVPRTYRGNEYNNVTNRYEDAYNEAHEALSFVLGMSKDDALAEARTGFVEAQKERVAAEAEVARARAACEVANDEIEAKERHIREQQRTIDTLKRRNEHLHESLSKGETVLGDLRKDFAKVKAAIGELRMKEILG